MPKSVELHEDKLFALPLQYVCPVKWKDMKGDDKVRACAACKKNVYNVAKLNRQQAIDLIERNEGTLCLRLFQRSDGTVITRECATILGMWRLRKKWNIFALINAGLAAAFGVAIPMLGPAAITILNGVGPITGKDHGDSVEEIMEKLPELEGYNEPVIPLPPEPSAAEIEQGRKGLE